MALLTAGTNATDSLKTLLFGRGSGAGGKMSATDLANLGELILDDQNVAHPIWPGALPGSGQQLYVPNRGFLNILPGDYVMVDQTTGWPILVSANAIASGPWTHS